VRLWKVKRTQGDIMRHMRWSSGLENHPDLVAYWWVGGWGGWHWVDGGGWGGVRGVWVGV